MKTCKKWEILKMWIMTHWYGASVQYTSWTSVCHRPVWHMTLSVSAVSHATPSLGMLWQPS